MDPSDPTFPTPRRQPMSNSSYMVETLAVSHEHASFSAAYRHASFGGLVIVMII